MIVIVEGTDLVGKSTLAERLSTDRGWPVVKLRWDLLGDPMVETTAMARATIALLQALRPDVIFDRSFLSWWAYGPVLSYDVAYMPGLAAGLARLPDLRVVLLTAAADELERRFNHQPDQWFGLEQIIAANERVPSIVDLLPETVARLTVDTTTSGPDDVFGQVVRFLHRDVLPSQPSDP
jgi:thymidylate kinase